MNNIFKRIKSFLTDVPDVPSSNPSEDEESEEYLAEHRKAFDSFAQMVGDLIQKEAMQRKRLEMIEDFLERIGLEIPPPELDGTAAGDDETAGLLSIYASIIRKIIRPVWEECEKAGTDAVDDLVEAVNNQMAELS